MKTPREGLEIPEGMAPVSMDVGEDHYWVLHPWAARVAVALTFCAGMAVGALIITIAYVS